MYVLLLNKFVHRIVIEYFRDLLAATRTSYLYICKRRKTTALARKLSKPSLSWQSPLFAQTENKSVTEKKLFFKDKYNQKIIQI